MINRPSFTGEGGDKTILLHIPIRMHAKRFSWLDFSCLLFEVLSTKGVDTVLQSTERARAIARFPFSASS